MAATGQESNQYNPAPLPTYGYDPGTQMVQQQQLQQAQYNQPSPPPGNWLEALAQYA